MFIHETDVFKVTVEIKKTDVSREERQAAENLAKAFTELLSGAMIAPGRLKTFTDAMAEIGQKMIDGMQKIINDEIGNGN